jgi:hypothetical protein
VELCGAAVVAVYAREGRRAAATTCVRGLARRRPCCLTWLLVLRGVEQGGGEHQASAGRRLLEGVELRDAQETTSRAADTGVGGPERGGGGVDLT